MTETREQGLSRVHEKSVEDAGNRLETKSRSEVETVSLLSLSHPQPFELANFEYGHEEDGTASYASSPSIDLGHWSEDEVELGRTGEEPPVITACLESDPESQPHLQQWLQQQISATSYVSIPALPVSENTLEKPETPAPLPSLCSSYPIGITARILSNIILPNDRLKPEIIEQHRKIVAARVPVALASHRLATGVSEISPAPPPTSSSSTIKSCSSPLSAPVQASGQTDALRGVPPNIFSANGQFNATLMRMIADAEARCAMFDEISKKVRTDTGWTAMDKTPNDEDFREEGGCGGMA